MLLRETQTTTQHQRTKESSKKLQITESTVLTVLILLTAPTAKTDLTSKSCKLACTQLFFLLLFFFLVLCLFCVCHGLAPGQITSRYLFIEKSMTWVKGREFCQSHFVDLAVLNTELEYFALLNATHTNKASFWLGLHRHANGWKWTDGDELSYRRWYNYNYEGQCASLEAIIFSLPQQHLTTIRKLFTKYLTFSN
uniref:C-type lectin domain-containing protein n=1 Tax=Cyprinodon variegatus TaxID=28743 RepID=A0A3Q2CX76_CYPVA